MKKETNLCMSCMCEKDYEGECKNCGYVDTGVYLASYLEPRTLLADRYIIGKLFSYNGEGAVYMAYDLTADTKVTIHEFMPDTLCTRKKGVESVTVNPDCLPLYKTYLSEFIELNRSLMKAGGITNIQTVLNVFGENNTAYAVYEYIEGITLKTYLSTVSGSLSWEQVRELFPPILTTLSLIHGSGTVHRGISPETVFVTDKKELKLIGFSISAARTADSDINYEVFSGYAPFEQYSSTERNGAWTDVYGISAVLYRVLTGQQPQNAVERVNHDTMVEPVLINRNIPQNVSRIIMKGLAVHPEHRIQSINEFVDRLFEQPSPEDNTASRPKATAAKPVKKPAPKKKGGKGKKKKTNVPALIGLIFGFLVILGFLFAIIYPTLNHEGTPAVTEVTTEAPAETTSGTINTTVASETTAPIANETVYVVPDLRTRPYDMIKDNAKYSFLTIIPAYEFNNDFSTGTIFEQDIDPNTEVTDGTTMNIKVSKGAESIALPDYEGLTFDEYKEILSKSNIKYESKPLSSEKKKDGYVIKCSVDVGDMVNVANAETVTVYVGKYKSAAATEAAEESDELDEA